ncbi:hypothetical protein [Streptomyces sp. NPDC057257]|uniref:hypothetical protein n=1 Tax=Streptomyces sp. NPDC057257 TaxID=3346071 RepID=UPI0036262390
MATASASANRSPCPPAAGAGRAPIAELSSRCTWCQAASSAADSSASPHASASPTGPSPPRTTTPAIPASAAARTNGPAAAARTPTASSNAPGVRPSGTLASYSTASVTGAASPAAGAVCRRTEVPPTTSRRSPRVQASTGLLQQTVG